MSDARSYHQVCLHWTTKVLFNFGLKVCHHHHHHHTLPPSSTPPPTQQFIVSSIMEGRRWRRLFDSVSTRIKSIVHRQTSWRVVCLLSTSPSYGNPTLMKNSRSAGPHAGRLPRLHRCRYLVGSGCPDVGGVICCWVLGAGSGSRSEAGGTNAATDRL